MLNFVFQQRFLEQSKDQKDVQSDMSLLLSQSAMKIAGVKPDVKIDLENDIATAFGKELTLNLTTSGHHI